MTAKVLVVDNDAEMLTVLHRHFESEGYAVTGAAGGPAALEAMERDDFDVILTDLVMDDVDGLTVMRQAQQRRPSPRVVLMTAFASLETAIEAIRAGAYDYLTKPFKLAEASLAIDALGALVDALGDRLAPHHEALREAVTQLRLAFVELSAPR